MRAFVAIAILVAMEASASAEPSAEQLYEEGQRAFDRGDFGTAIARWQSSYELSKLPLLVLNVAQAYRLAGHCAQALSAYRRYVALDPSSQQRGIADEFISELEPKCGSSSQLRVDQRTPKVEHPRAGFKMKAAGLVTGGAGLALVATGLMFGHRASSIGDDVGRECAVLCDWGEQKSDDARGRRYSKIGYAFDAVGVVAIASGAIMYFVGSRQHTVLAAPTHEGGAVISWSGSW